MWPILRQSPYRPDRAALLRVIRESTERVNLAGGAPGAAQYTQCPIVFHFRGPRERSSSEPSGATTEQLGGECRNHAVVVHFCRVRSLAIIASRRQERIRESTFPAAQIVHAG